MVKMSLRLWLGSWLLMQKEQGDGFLLRSHPIIIIIVHGLWNGDITSLGATNGRGCFEIYSYGSQR